MLGLGNALTRSINYGKIGEAAIFNNAPAIGSRQYGGIVLKVNPLSSPTAEANAEIIVAFPHPIQFPIGNNVYSDKQYLNYGIDYIQNTFSSIEDGEVYEDWTVASPVELELWLDTEYSPEKYSTDLFLAVNFDYLNSYDPQEKVSVDLFQSTITSGFGLYHSSDYKTKKYNPPVDFFQNNPVYLLPVRKINVALETPSEIPLVDSGSTSGTQVKNINNPVFNISVNDFNNESLNKTEEQYERNYNDLYISTKNGVITCTIKFSLGNQANLFAQKYLELPQAWRSLTSMSANFNLHSLHHTDPSDSIASELFLFGINTFLSYFDQIKINRTVPIRKVNQGDFDPNEYLLVNDIVYNIFDGQVVEGFVARVFEIDLSALPALPLLASVVKLGYQKTGNPTAFDSIYHDDSIVTIDEVVNPESTLNDIHFSQGASTPLPRGLWWGRFKISDLKFTSPAFIESQTIESPPTLQNIVVPMIPVIGGLNINVGDDLETSNFFKLSDFFSSTLHPINVPSGNKTMTVIGSVKYAVPSESDLSTIDTELLESGDNVFVGDGGNFYDSIHSWDGSVFTEVSSSLNDTYNFRGSMYKKGATFYELLDSTDIINYE